MDATPTRAGTSHLINDRQSLPLPYGHEAFPFDLAAVIEAWASLPDAIRAGIVAMVKASKGS